VGGIALRSFFFISLEIEKKLIHGIPSRNAGLPEGGIDLRSFFFFSFFSDSTFFFPIVNYSEEMRTHSRIH